MPIAIQIRMKFFHPLGLTKGRPEKNLQAGINGRAFKQIEVLFLETKTRHQPLPSFQYYISKGFTEGGRLSLVGLGKGGSGDIGKSQMVELSSSMNGYIGDDAS